MTQEERRRQIRKKMLKGGDGGFSVKKFTNLAWVLLQLAGGLIFLSITLILLIAWLWLTGPFMLKLLGF